MDTLHQLELAWIIIVQSLGAWLQEPMRLVSLLGQEEFYMLVMPVLYWSMDARLGFRVGVMLLLSNGLNAAAKMSLHTPRPYWLGEQVRGLATEPTFGLPSGHAQSAASIWGLIAVSTRDQLSRVVLILLIFLIGFSRVYLGVHFISDVVAGWLIGGLTLWAFLALERPAEAWLKKQSLAALFTVALLTSLAIMLAIVLTSAAFSRFETPAEWQANAYLASAENLLEPFHIEGAFTISGTWFGFMAGAAWLYHRQGGYDASGSPGQRLLRYVIGVSGIFVFWFLLGQIFPREADFTSYLLRYLRYTLIGLWISAAAPLLFSRLGLAAAPGGKIAPFSSKENPL
jgi:membrane-associated phospholipid phosphatase